MSWATAARAGPARSRYALGEVVALWLSSALGESYRGGMGHKLTDGLFWVEGPDGIPAGLIVTSRDRVAEAWRAADPRVGLLQWLSDGTDPLAVQLRRAAQAEES